MEPNATPPNESAVTGADLRDIERLEMDRATFKAERSILSVFVKLAIPVFLAAIAVAQLVTAVTDYLARKARADQEARDRTDQGERDWSKMSRDWAEFVLKVDAQLRSADPRERCRAVGLLRLAAPSNTKTTKDDYFRSHTSDLKVDVGLCSSETEFARAIAQFNSEQWGPYRMGAEPPYIRKDPQTGQLFTHTCTVSTAKGKIGDDECAIPSPGDARIYRVEYSCTDFKCGWSYNRDPAKGYAIDYKQSGPASIHWYRRWDGDPHQEAYVLYYEKREQGTPPPRSP